MELTLSFFDIIIILLLFILSDFVVLYAFYKTIGVLEYKTNYIIYSLKKDKIKKYKKELLEENTKEAEDNKELPMKKRELIQPISQFEFNTLTTKYKHTLKNYQKLYVYTTDSKTTVTEYEVLYNRLSRDPVIVEKGTYKIEGVDYEAKS